MIVANEQKGWGGHPTRQWDKIVSIRVQILFETNKNTLFLFSFSVRGTAGKKWVSENGRWTRICLWRGNEPLSNQSHRAEEGCIENRGEFQIVGPS